MCGKKLLAWGQPGVEPGTFRTRSETHTPYPTGSAISRIVSQYKGISRYSPLLLHIYHDWDYTSYEY